MSVQHIMCLKLHNKCYLYLPLYSILPPCRLLRAIFTKRTPQDMCIIKVCIQKHIQWQDTEIAYIYKERLKHQKSQ